MPIRVTHNSQAAKCGYLPDIQAELLDLQAQIRADWVSLVVDLHRRLHQLQKLVTRQLEAQGAY